MKKPIFYFIMVLFSFSVYSQTVKNDTTNRVDANGKKQGYWKKIVRDILNMKALLRIIFLSDSLNIIMATEN